MSNEIEYTADCIDSTLNRIEDILIGQYGNGLTKREHFAAMAMQGNLKAFHDCDVTDFTEIAHDCVMMADALLAELAKEAGQ